jgi:hypothetical protein
MDVLIKLNGKVALPNEIKEVIYKVSVATIKNQTYI